VDVVRIRTGAATSLEQNVIELFVDRIRLSRETIGRAAILDRCLCFRDLILQQLCSAHNSLYSALLHPRAYAHLPQRAVLSGTQRYERIRIYYDLSLRRLRHHGVAPRKRESRRVFAGKNKCARWLISISPSTLRSLRSRSD